MSFVNQVDYTTNIYYSVASAAIKCSITFILVLNVLNHRNHYNIITWVLWVDNNTLHSEFLEYWIPKKCLEDLTTFFMSTWWGNSKNMEEIEFSRWLFEGRPRQGKNVLPDGLNWQCYFAGSSKSHRENSISCIFLESPHQVDMQNIVKRYKYFFGYFNALKSHSV